MKNNKIQQSADSLSGIVTDINDVEKTARLIDPDFSSTFTVDNNKAHDPPTRSIVSMGLAFGATIGAIIGLIVTSLIYPECLPVSIPLIILLGILGELIRRKMRNLTFDPFSEWEKAIQNTDEYLDDYNIENLKLYKEVEDLRKNLQQQIDKQIHRPKKK